jgi:hypothetical protein
MYYLQAQLVGRYRNTDTSRRFELASGPFARAYWFD